MKKFMIFAVIAALFMTFSLTAFAQSDASDGNIIDYETESNGDGIEEIILEAPAEDSESSEDGSSGFRLALTVILSSLGAIAVAGTAAAIYVTVRSKKLNK